MPRLTDCLSEYFHQSHGQLLCFDALNGSFPHQRECGFSLLQRHRGQRQSKCCPSWRLCRLQMVIISSHLEGNVANKCRLVGPGSIPEEGNDSKFWAYHSYVSMYQDADAGVRGPFIAYNQGKMDEVTANNCEFTLFYGDNQESNSFFAMQNIQKYLPDVYPTIANTTDTYPMSTMNQTFWAPQVINSPLNTITTKMAPNFFPVRTAFLQSCTCIHSFDS